MGTNLKLKNNNNNNNSAWQKVVTNLQTLRLFQTLLQILTIAHFFFNYYPGMSQAACLLLLIIVHLLADYR